MRDMDMDIDISIGVSNTRMVHTEVGSLVSPVGCSVCIYDVLYM